MNNFLNQVPFVYRSLVSSAPCGRITATDVFYFIGYWITQHVYSLTGLLVVGAPGATCLSSDSRDASVQPKRIHPPVRIRHIPLRPLSPRKPYRVRAQILPRLRIIVPEAAVLEAGFLIEPLALKTDRAVRRGVVVGGTAGEGFRLAPQV